MVYIDTMCHIYTDEIFPVSVQENYTGHGKTFEIHFYSLRSPLLVMYLLKCVCISLSVGKKMQLEIKNLL